jgi:acylglycerol lipase
VYTILAEAGIAVYAFDMHSHGKSEPLEPEHLRVAIRSADDCLDDVRGFLEAVVRPRAQNLPLFGFGHSIGGGILSLVECQNPGTFAVRFLLLPDCASAAQTLV